MPRRQVERQDRCEFCPWCLRRDCRGCDKGNTLLSLSEDQEKEKPQPLRLTGWKPPERKKDDDAD